MTRCREAGSQIREKHFLADQRCEEPPYCVSWGGFSVLILMMVSNQSKGQPASSVCESLSLSTDHCNMDQWIVLIVGTICI